MRIMHHNYNNEHSTCRYYSFKTKPKYIKRKNLKKYVVVRVLSSLKLREFRRLYHRELYSVSEIGVRWR